MLTDRAPFATTMNKTPAMISRKAQQLLLLVV
jgi:hypothetical protein